MRKNRAVLLTGLALITLASCGGGKTSSNADSLSSASASSSGTSGATSAPISSVSGSGSSSITSSSSEAKGDPFSTSYTGLVRIYYHNDASSYSNKALWIWAGGVDGYEAGFDNLASPDEYGVYHDIDFATAPFYKKRATIVDFIVKPVGKGNWAGQSSDTICDLDNFTINKSKTSDGRDLVTVYALDGGDGTIQTFAKKEDALGDRFGDASFTDWKTLHLKGTGTAGTRSAEDVGRIASYSLYAFTREYWALTKSLQAAKKANYLLKSDSPNANEVNVSFDAEIDPSIAYYVEATFTQDTSKSKHATANYLNLYATERFETNYTYEGEDLGYSLDSEGNECFKVWAPTASSVAVKEYLYGQSSALNTDTVAHPEYDYFGYSVMTYGDHGVWSLKKKAGSYHFYVYDVIAGGSESLVADPYAHAAGVNGLRSALTTASDWTDATPAGYADSIASLKSKHPLASPNALSVYEAHVRDFTADKSWISNKGNANGSYLAFAESGTTYGANGTTVKTGLDHLEELGVNAVQLLPVFDQDNDERTYDTTTNGVKTHVTPGYNWGYNPLNYNVVEGAYSSDPYTPMTRVKEFKTLVQALADKGMRTIMDVVYNHVSSVSSSAFNLLVPKYYFRLNSDGSYSAGTGCGNDFASEKTMARRYIVNSIAWWAKEYGIKGFRFDLMGSLDLATMKAVKAACYAIDPEIVVYGEPWVAGGTALAESERAVTTNVYSSLYDCGHGDVVGCFNDECYGAFVGNTEYGTNLPGYGFISKGPGYLTSDILTKSSQALIGANGTRGANPYQAVNYVACHDNYTLYDHLNYCLGSGTASMADNETAMKATVAAQDAVLLSQGIAFINGGDEIMRQKAMAKDDVNAAKLNAGDAITLADGNYLMRNSYAYGDAVNSFKWDRKANATIKGYCQKIAEAVALRSSLMGNVFGKSYTDISSSSPTAWAWGSLKADNLATAAAAKDSANSEYYVVIGGHVSGDWASISIGNGTLQVAYTSDDSKHSAGQNCTITNELMGVGAFEAVLLKRTA
jgi:type I pullulanase